MESNNEKTIVFITGTRADFGKLKPIIRTAIWANQFHVHIFVTGMHLLSNYGYTAHEVEKEGFQNIYKFMNQSYNDSMDVILAKTIMGFSDFVKEIRPDMIVIHGDRVEALAGAIVGCLNNILVSHIEGGEVSGTIDDLLRHSITKLSHLHLVCNNVARRRLLQMGEEEKCIRIIGSPDIDIMTSGNIPPIEKAKERYGIPFDQYSLFMYHPVTTEIQQLRKKVNVVVEALLANAEKYVVVYPNNDTGSDIIIEALERIRGNERFRLFPSIRFEYFLSLLKHADIVIGNSSAGVREAPFYGTPTVNLGTRQSNRSDAPTIINAVEENSAVVEAIARAHSLPRIKTEEFGDGRSSEHFLEFLTDEETWKTLPQKRFNDVTFHSNK